MLWFILALIVGVVFGIRVSVNNGNTFWEGVGKSILFIFLFSLIAMTGFMLSSTIADCCADRTYYTVEDVDVYALQDSVTTEGRFYLSSGHIDNELKYFYVKQSDVGYTIDNVDADKSYIRYTSDRCHIETQKYKFNNKFIQVIAAPMEPERHIIYIPDGSVINNYAIDLR